ncbi:hypothetical protein IAF48_20240, partial [Acinetobacter baumannii]|nr:hypothetical protein [Acinetobacter baumannii]
RSEDKNSAKRFSTQLKVIKDLNDHWSIANSTLYQNNKDLGDSVDSSIDYICHSKNGHLLGLKQVGFQVLLLQNYG